MIVIVAGFGRCGSSLCMQMLSLGGMPCAGRWPAYEPAETRGIVLGETLSLEWLHSIDGHAVKVLDPQNGRIPEGPDYFVIWLSRDPAEQARSQMKLVNMMGFPVTREMRTKFRRSYVEDRPAAMRSLFGCKPKAIVEVQYEQLIRRPLDTAKLIAGHITRYGGKELDAAKMASAVRKTDPRAAPDMAMEIQLIEEGQPA